MKIVHLMSVFCIVIEKLPAREENETFHGAQRFHWYYSQGYYKKRRTTGRYYDSSHKKWMMYVLRFAVATSLNNLRQDHMGIYFTKAIPEYHVSNTLPSYCVMMQKSCDSHSLCDFDDVPGMLQKGLTVRVRRCSLHTSGLKKYDRRQVGTSIKLVRNFGYTVKASVWELEMDNPKFGMNFL
jgi:hypothetical protein